jgi:hypothetical protein
MGLIVGRLPDHVEPDDAAAYLTGAIDAALTSDAQAALLQVWDPAPEEMAYFDALNKASLVSFVLHAARLEGLQGFNEALARGYWIKSYWLLSAPTREPMVPCSSAVPTDCLPTLQTSPPPHRTGSAPYLSISS